MDVPLLTVSLQSPEALAPQAMPVPETEPFVGVGEIVSVGLAKTTDTVVSASTFTSQVAAVPEQPPPLHDRTAWLAAGDAVRVTFVPAFTVSAQSPVVPAPQAMPVPVTEPFVGAGETVSVGLVSRANVTVTVTSAVTEAVQVAPVPEQPPPLHPPTA